MYRFVVLLLLANVALSKVKPIFDFSDQEDAIAWSRDVLKLKEQYDSKDKKKASAARKEVAELSRQWREYFGIKWPKKNVKSLLERFTENLWSVGEKNVALAAKKSSWWMSLGKFADLSFDQFKRKYLIDDIKLPKLDINLEDLKIKLFDCLDWRQKNVVTAVKNQQVCLVLLLFPMLSEF